MNRVRYCSPTQLVASIQLSQITQVKQPHIHVRLAHYAINNTDYVKLQITTQKCNPPITILRTPSIVTPITFT
jgi:hypothetical protein